MQRQKKTDYPCCSSWSLNIFFDNIRCYLSLGSFQEMLQTQMQGLFADHFLQWLLMGKYAFTVIMQPIIRGINDAVPDM